MNLITNGSFEKPGFTVDPSSSNPVERASWRLYKNDGDVPGWHLWSGSSGTGIEVQKGDAADGKYFAELDADQNGPGGGPHVHGSTRIFQDVTTVAGTTYLLSFSRKMRIRPGMSAADNVKNNYMGVVVQDLAASSVTNLPLEGNTRTVLTDAPKDWTHYLYSFTATSTQTRINFFDYWYEHPDEKFNDTYGCLLDNVRLEPTYTVRLQDAGHVTAGSEAKFTVILDRKVDEDAGLRVYYTVKTDRTDNDKALVCAQPNVDYVPPKGDAHIDIKKGEKEGTITIATKATSGAALSKEFLVVVSNAPKGYVVPRSESAITTNPADDNGLVLFTPTGRCQINAHGLTANPWANWKEMDSVSRSDTQVESLGYWRTTKDGGSVTMTTPKGNPWTHVGGSGSLMNAEGPYLYTTPPSNAFRMEIDYRCEDTAAHESLPTKTRNDRLIKWQADAITNQHYGNSGIYIFNQFEVQIVDPSRGGSGGTPRGSVIKKADGVPRTQMVAGGPYCPKGMEGSWAGAADTTQPPSYKTGVAEYRALKPGETYGFYYNFRNLANPVNDWNKMVIEFHPPVLNKDASGKVTGIVTPAYLAVWLNPKDPKSPTDSELAYKGWLVDNDGNALKGTGSRANMKISQVVDSGNVYLQSHWGSQVEFRDPTITTLK